MPASLRSSSAIQAPGTASRSRSSGRLQRNLGVTTLYVTHDQREVPALLAPKAGMIAIFVVTGMVLIVRVRGVCLIPREDSSEVWAQPGEGRRESGCRWSRVAADTGRGVRPVLARPAGGVLDSPGLRSRHHERLRSQLQLALRIYGADVFRPGRLPRGGG